MSGVWLAAMAMVFVAAGVVAQLGWQLPEMTAFNRVVVRSLRRSRWRQPSGGPSSVAAPEPR